MPTPGQAGGDDDDGDDEEDVDGAPQPPPRDPRAVRGAYDEIAGHFAETREYAWPEVEAFLEDVSTGDVGLDVGCGNGRHTEQLVEVVDRAVALDLSRQVLATARSRAADRGWDAALVQGDGAALPLRSDTVDVAIYVATVHHLPTTESRVESLDELARVLGPDGHALVSAWSTAHDRFDAGADDAVGFDTTVDWTLPGGETVPRYYHIYAPDEFERDLRSSALVVERQFVSSGNCYARVRSEQ
jgi:tRNA (uracil-5-)-methyltransferase TRM9